MSGYTLADYDELLTDVRVGQLDDRLRGPLKLDDEITFATYVQPAAERQTDSGIVTTQPPMAVFAVISPQPNPRHGAHPVLKSVAACTLQDWREREAEAWHFAGFGDPAEPIFRQLAIAHMAVRQSYRDIIHIESTEDM